MYIYKLPIAEGRPAIKLMNLARWYYLKREGTLRFRHIRNYLSLSECPMVEYERGYLVLKISPVREKLITISPDLIHDAIITDKKIEGVWEDIWTVSTVKPDAKLLALWQVGLKSKAHQKLKDFIGLYKALLEELEKTGSKV